MTIKTRLTLWYSAAWLAFFFVFTGGLYYASRSFLIDEMRQHLQTEAGEIAQDLSWTPDSFQVRDEHEWKEIEHQVDSEYAVYIQVLDSRGRVLRRSENLLKTGEYLPRAPEAGRRRSTLREGARHDKPFFVYWHPLADEAGNFAGWLQLGAYETRIEAFMRLLSRWLLFGIPVGLSCCIAIGWWMARKALEPLDEIAAIAATINSERLDTRIPANGGTPREVSQITAALNALLLRLENSFNQAAQFTNDAAHELLTPLTSLLSDIEITLRRKRSRAEHVDTLQRLKEDTERMVEVVKNLLFLARADREQLVLHFDPLFPGAILQQVLVHHASSMRARSIRLEYRLSDAEIEGNEVLLGQLFANLMENAIAYTPEGGRIQVESVCEQGFWSCRFTDSGIGIPARMQEQIFARFFRADPSRRRDPGGAGLGLSIAREIAQLHKGSLRLVWSREGEGSCFEVRLPLGSSVAPRSEAAPAAQGGDGLREEV